MPSANQTKPLYLKKLTHIVRQFTAAQPDLLAGEQSEDSDAEERARRAQVELKRAQRERETRDKMPVRAASAAPPTLGAALETAYFSRCAGIALPDLALFEQTRGAVGGFARLGEERLGGNKGKNFRKEKSKLKNREFQGGAITKHSNLVDLDL